MFNKEHYRAHINNRDTHTEFAMYADSLRLGLDGELSHAPNP
jgi:hypothetical protein